MIAFAACAAIVLLSVLFAWMRERRLRDHAGLLGEILDLADTLERELLESRARLRELPALVAALKPVDPLSGRAIVAAESQVQDALRDLLAHRLWLKEHAARATIGELQSARDALVATRSSLAAQLARLAEARADFKRSRDPLR